MLAGIIPFILLSFLYFLFLHFNCNLTAAAAITDMIFNMAAYGSIIAVLPYSSKYINFEPSKSYKFIFTHFFGGVIVSALCTLAYFEFSKAVNQYALISISSLLWRFVYGIFFYLIAQMVIYAVLFYNKLLKQTEEDGQLKLYLKEAELRSLRFQINPHFLFNTLNSIVSLISSDPASARTMVIKLSDFYRASLSLDNRLLVPLSKEFGNIERYLDIEKARFQEKLSVCIQFPEDTCDIKVPNMIMQPIVENAIKHGVYDSLSPVEIKLFTIHDGEYIKIICVNNFESYSGRKKSGNGIGLTNTRKRLELIFNNPNLLSTTVENSLFTVIISIPFEQNGI